MAGASFIILDEACGGVLRQKRVKHAPTTLLKKPGFQKKTGLLLTQCGENYV